MFATVLEQFYPGRRGREGLLRHLSKANTGLYPDNPNDSATNPV